MGSYLLIQSRDPYDGESASRGYALATSLKAQGHKVTVFLVQNGVFPARRGARSEDLVKLSGAGVDVLADEFSLRERGIGADRLVPGVKSAAIDTVIAALADGTKTLWH